MPSTKEYLKIFPFGKMFLSPSNLEMHPKGEEENPSATYNTEKQVWICHACGTKGGYTDLSRYLNLNLTTFSNNPFKPTTTNNKWSTTPWWQLEKANIHPIALYDYTDEKGKLLYQVGRFEHNGKKTFRQRRPQDKGWLYKLNDCQKVLYKLPKVLKALKTGEAIYLCEGEKDANNLEELGLIATCNVGGANKWLDQYTGCPH